MLKLLVLLFGASLNFLIWCRAIAILKWLTMTKSHCIVYAVIDRPLRFGPKSSFWYSKLDDLPFAGLLLFGMLRIQWKFWCTWYCSALVLLRTVASWWFRKLMSSALSFCNVNLLAIFRMLKFFWINSSWSFSTERRLCWLTSFVIARSIGFFVFDRYDSILRTLLTVMICNAGFGVFWTTARK